MVREEKILLYKSIIEKNDDKHDHSICYFNHFVFKMEDLSGYLNLYFFR